MKRLFGSSLLRAVVPLAALIAALAAWRAGILPTPVEQKLTNVSNEGQNAQGLVLLTRNYYEELTDVDRGLWRGGPGYKLALRILKGKQAANAEGDDRNWVRLGSSGAIQRVDGFLEYELLPDLDMTFMGARLQTNRWGHRDRHYELQKPPGTFRIAMVGASNSMGYGVELDEVFCEIIEKQLNDELAGGHFQRYEVINFSVGGYQMLDRMYVLETKVPPFDPDLVLIEVTMHDLRWAIQGSIIERFNKGLDLRYDYVKSVVQRAGVTGDESTLGIRRRLRPFLEPLATACFLDIKGISEATGIPVAIAHLRLRVDDLHDSLRRQAELSENEGLITLRVFDSYEGQSPDELYLTPVDYHPTVKGHQLIADELYEKMLSHPEIRRMLIPSSAAPGEEGR